MVRYVACFLAIVAVFSLAGCEKKEATKKEDKVEVAACAAKASELTGELECSCPAGTSGSVWGTGTYTADSNICAAAVHAGAIKGEGGTVKVKIIDGCGVYRASEANGVSSSSWGPWTKSFYFDGHGDGVCDAGCPGGFGTVGNLQADSELTCECPAGAASGSVWGTGVYTQDSNICAAAAHAGAVDPAAGGEVTAKAAPGCQVYKGSDANGVKSSDWGAFGKSFYFPTKGDGACPNFCPANFKAIADRNDSTEITCECPAGTASGSVWGSSVYTLDSSICAAALHAGAVDANGGEVTVKAAAGCAKYVGSNANGVNSSNWGAYEGSFYFPAKGEPACAP